MKKEINLADIRAFVQIAKLGSFTAVAQQLGCSRSHLSKQLLQLENALGVKLIIRTTRSQRMTEQGKQFFIQCNSALGSIDNAIERVIDGASAVKGTINVNCIGGHIGEEIIAPLVNRFINQHPGITINLDFSSQRVDLISGEFDVVFRMGLLEDSNLIARKLVDIPIGTLASPSYLHQHGSLNHPKELKQHQCITGSLKQWIFVNENQPDNRVDVTVAGAFQCKSGRAMIVSALSGNGILRVPLLYCAKEIASGELVSVFEHWKVPETPLYLVYAQDKYQPARLKTFIRFIHEHIGAYTAVT